MQGGPRTRISSTVSSAALSRGMMPCDDAAPPAPHVFVIESWKVVNALCPRGASSEVGGGRPGPTGGQVGGQPVVPAAHPTHWPMRRVPAVWVLFARPTMASGEARAQAQGGAAPAVGPACPPRAPSWRRGQRGGAGTRGWSPAASCARRRTMRKNGARGELSTAHLAVCACCLPAHTPTWPCGHALGGWPPPRPARATSRAGP